MQTRILDGIRREQPGVSNVEIANEAGCDKSQITRFGDGEREMRVGELVALVRAYGAPAVLAPLAALDGCTVGKAEATPATDLLGALLDVSSRAAALPGVAHRALADRVLSPAERADLLRGIDDTIAELQRARAALSPVAMAPTRSVS